MNLGKIKPMFAVPFYEGIVQVSDDLVDSVKGLEYYRFPAGNGYSTIDQNLHRHDNSDIQNVIDKISRHRDYYVHTVMGVPTDVQLEIMSCWAVKHDVNDWAQAHLHRGSALTGILYLRCDDKSGDITFEVPGWNQFLPDVFYMRTTPNEYNAREITITPQQGDLFIFPGFVKHRVSKNLSNQDRYVLVFDLFPTGNFIHGLDNSMKLSACNESYSIR